MANKIEWWLVEVERRLSKYLSEQQIEEILVEAREHLCQIRDEHQDSINPELEAIRKFGSPDAFADEVIDSLGLRSPKRAFWQVFFAAAALTLLPIITLESYRFIQGQPYWSLLLIPLLAVGFVRVCLRNRKLHFVPILSGAFLGYVLGASYMSLTYVGWQSSGAIRITEAKAAIVESQTVLSSLADAKRRLEQWDNVSFNYDPISGNYEAPYFHVTVKSSPVLSETPQLVTISTANRKQATDAYATSMQTLRRQGGTIKSIAESNIASLITVTSRPLKDNLKSMFGWVSPIMLPPLVLMPVLNLIVLLWVGIARNIRRREMFA